MILKVKTGADVAASEVTPEAAYRSRREFLRTAAGAAAGAAAVSFLSTRARAAGPDAADIQGNLASLKAKPSPFSADPNVDPATSYEIVTGYNNYYEFGTRKNDPARNAGGLKVKPWTVKVDGLCSKPGNYGVEDLVDFNNLEERIYRHRCVEGWSYVVPWIGASLSETLKKVQPQPSAKFVEFTTAVRPGEMTGLDAFNHLDWPYIEGLRMDEAMHPLTMMVVGLYGKVLPNQNGAPLRVHIPWKYGFKSGKSIVRIRFTDKQPANTWAVHTPNEYGFYANVNPTVDHPRWSQAREQRFPGLLKNHPTVMFNGYGDQVASLYAGMDLRKNFEDMSPAAAIDRVLRTRWFYIFVFVACLVPGAVLAWQFYGAAVNGDVGPLGVDPVKETLHTLGRYALTLVLLALAVTPVRRFFGLNGLQRVRRMVGVWAFVYAALHVTTYLIFEQLCYSPSTCQWHDIWLDFTKRPFIFMGLLAFTILLALAVTSTNGWIRRLGKRWTTIDRLVYVAALAAVIHFKWGQKSDFRLPFTYLGILVILLGARVYLTVEKQRARQRSGIKAH